MEIALFIILGIVSGILIKYTIVSYIKESIKFKKLWKRSGLTIIITLLSLTSFGQLNTNYKPKTRYNNRPLFERVETQQKRVITMIAVNLAIFAVNEYALHTDNRELRQSCTAAFFGANIAGATWVLSVNTHMDNRPFKVRFKQNNKWLYR